MYWAPFGTTEPADSTVTPQGYLTIPPSPWTDIGGTTGGVNFEIDNVQPLCGPCNSSKGTRIIDFRRVPISALLDAA